MASSDRSGSSRARAEEEAVRPVPGPGGHAVERADGRRGRGDERLLLGGGQAGPPRRDAGYGQAGGDGGDLERPEPRQQVGHRERCRPAGEHGETGDGVLRRAGRRSRRGGRGEGVLGRRWRGGERQPRVASGRARARAPARPSPAPPASRSSGRPTPPATGRTPPGRRLPRGTGRAPWPQRRRRPGRDQQSAVSECPSEAVQPGCARRTAGRGRRRRCTGRRGRARRPTRRPAGAWPPCRGRRAVRSPAPPPRTPAAGGRSTRRAPPRPRGRRRTAAPRVTAHGVRGLGAPRGPGLPTCRPPRRR